MNSSVKQRLRFFNSLFAFTLAVVAAPVMKAQCTLQLSDSGIVRLQSGQERELTWNTVPGASSYLVETLIEGLNEPSGPDFTFGGPYTESRNVEGRSITSIPVRHSVLYKMRFRYIVTALNRENSSFQPCSDDVLYVVEADQERAEIAARRIVPLAGKARGMNGSNYSTALILAGSGLGQPAEPGEEKLYQGRVYFRPLGAAISESDKYVEYAMDGDETIVFDDVMDSIGATGIGSLEVVPRTGFPTPLADAIIDNQLPDNTRTGARIQAVWGRDQLATTEVVTVGIRNTTDSRLAIGVRTLGNGGRVYFQHLASNGDQIDTAERYIDGGTTMLYSLAELFSSPMNAGDRIIFNYQGFELNGGMLRIESKGVVLFLTETGNRLNNPNVIPREPMNGRRYEQGFDRFLLY